ncbi:hypothetical protein B0H10DRAFT_1982110 [Mycena sp. CBHHK59/15]|nr:hypothetical protein B0H10DRAFT_1982110 [Mycena sp. CBHHK59/15]
MLEVEMQSPSFRTTRSVSAKRGRSPDSPCERPAKRLSLAIGDPLSHVPSQPAFHYLNSRSSASNSRHSSEDWVQQAGGLSIDSPLFPTLGASIPERISADERMLVDADDLEDASDMSRRPYLPPLQTQPDAFMHAGASFSYDTPVQERPPDRSSTRSYSAHGNAPPAGSLFLPVINILPATPNLLSARTRPSTPIRDASSESSMNISPTVSFANLGSPIIGRKQRFMMGPRANCEKCRLGVKGHSVHLD